MNKERPEIKVGVVFILPQGKENDLTKWGPKVFGYLLKDDEGFDEKNFDALLRSLWRFGFDGGLAGHV